MLSSLETKPLWCKNLVKIALYTQANAPELEPVDYQLQGVVSRLKFGLSDLESYNFIELIDILLLREDLPNGTTFFDVTG